MNQKSNKTIKIVILLIPVVLVVSGIIYYWQFFVLQRDAIINQEKVNNINVTETTKVTTDILNESGTSTSSIFIDENFKPNPSEEQKKELITKKFNDLDYKISPIKEIVPLPLEVNQSKLEDDNSSNFQQPLSKCNSSKSDQPILGCNVVVDAKINRVQIEELSQQIISDILKEKKDAERIKLYFYTDEDLVGTPVDLAMVTWANGEIKIEMVEK